MTPRELAKMFLGGYVMILGVGLGVGALPVWRAVVAWVRGTEIDTTGLNAGFMWLAVAVLVVWLGGRLWWRTMYRVGERAERKAAQEKAEAARSPALQAFNERLDVFTTRLNRWLLGWLVVFWVVFGALVFVADSHWIWGTLFFVWMFGSLPMLIALLVWVERRLCRELGLTCPHCGRMVIITSRRREEPAGVSAVWWGVEGVGCRAGGGRGR